MIRRIQSWEIVEGILFEGLEFRVADLVHSDLCLLQPKTSPDCYGHEHAACSRDSLKARSRGLLLFGSHQDCLVHSPKQTNERGRLPTGRQFVLRLPVAGRAVRPTCPTTPPGERSTPGGLRVRIELQHRLRPMAGLSGRTRAGEPESRAQAGWEQSDTHAL